MEGQVHVPDILVVQIAKEFLEQYLENDCLMCGNVISLWIVFIYAWKKGDIVRDEDIGYL